jgi:hypothetical protein
VEGITSPRSSRGRSGARRVERVVELPVSAAAPVQARRAVAAFPGMAGDLGYKALLLASESVTATVLAAEAEPYERIELRAAISSDQVRIEVDPVGAPGGETHVHLSSYATRIFERTATRWGTDDGHAAIWFELAR